MAIAVVFVAASLTVVLAFANQRGSSVSTSPTTSSFSSPSSSAGVTTATTVSISSLTTTVAGNPTTNVNGSLYYSDDVSSDTTVGFPGYSYFHNTSVTFRGVKFQTYCPPSFIGCPAFTGTTTTTYTYTTASAGVMFLTVTFPDKTNQTVSAIIGDDDYIFAFTHHDNIQAGFLVVYSTSAAGGFKVFLLIKNILQLQLSVSASGGTVIATADDFNTLASATNITTSDAWMVPLGYYNGPPCWSNDYIVGLGIAEGHYTASNVTAAKFLDLVNPQVTYSCTLFLGYGTPRGFVFLSLSDTATEYGCIGTSPCLSGSASTGVTVTGYWSQGGVFTSFPSGTYTVLAEDEWGYSTLAYFAVP